MADSIEAIAENLNHHLSLIYDELDTQAINALSESMINIMAYDDALVSPRPHTNLWDEADICMITYADSVLSDNQSPLKTLSQFYQDKLAKNINIMHLLPFYPWSSDDGFAVKDFYAVNPSVGSWDDIKAIAQQTKLMADLVINHCSSESQWFKNFIAGEGEGHDYFYTVAKDAPIQHVVRPRTSPLLQSVQTKHGEQWVWCTFSHDQVDLDFSNPQLLLEMIKVIKSYIDHGIRIFRLDAVAFLWKDLGTTCLNLPKTHEVVRLIRSLVEHKHDDIIIITETNIPNRENLSYFGNANEAHWVYNFSLPPLLINTLITGDCNYLKQWSMSLPPAQDGTSYFNFIASHDGIGLRPAEGLLDDEEIASLINTMIKFGGQVSWRAGDNGIKKPYEINIALYDSLQGTTAGQDNYNLSRYICAHAIMLALEGVPALYIHSLFGTLNDDERVKKHNHKRAINRHQWQQQDLENKLNNPDSHHRKVFDRLNHLMAIRRQQKAFHPNAVQYTLHISDQVFGFWRQSRDRQQSVFCINNISDQVQSLQLADLNLVSEVGWYDLISGVEYHDHHIDIQLKPYQSLWISNR